MQFINAHNVKYTPDKFLSYNDVLLLPHRSDLTSRNDAKIDLSTKFTSNINLNTPILSANMDTISEADMVLAMASHGGFGILHRFYNDKERFRADVEKIVTKYSGIAFSIGTNPDDLSIVNDITKIYEKAQIVVCVDVANGHLRKSLDQISKLRKTFGSRIQIIGGNVCTPQGVMDLVSHGVDAVKIGIGGGSLCSTRLVTGHGMPMLTSIIQARQTINALQSNVAIIADGGIKTSGDIVKALAAGADSVMVGGLLAATVETPGPRYIKTSSFNGLWKYEELDLVNNTEEAYKEFNFIQYKKYRGQSSKDFMDSIEKVNVAPEGEHTYLPCRGPVGDILKNLIGGIRSGMTYTGAKNLHELSEKALFIEIGQHGYIEGTPHGV